MSVLRAFWDWLDVEPEDVPGATVIGTLVASVGDLFVYGGDLFVGGVLAAAGLSDQLLPMLVNLSRIAPQVDAIDRAPINQAILAIVVVLGLAWIIRALYRLTSLKRN